MTPAPYGVGDLITSRWRALPSKLDDESSSIIVDLAREFGYEMGDTIPGIELGEILCVLRVKRNWGGIVHFAMVSTRTKRVNVFWGTPDFFKRVSGVP